MLELPGDEFVTLELVHVPSTGGRRRQPAPPPRDQCRIHGRRAAHLRAADIEVDEPASPDGSPDFLTAMLADPNRNQIELVQWPPGHAEGDVRCPLSLTSHGPRDVPRVVNRADFTA
jgi:lactoylglutathione lyase